MWGKFSSETLIKRNFESTSLEYYDRRLGHRYSLHDGSIHHIVEEDSELVTEDNCIPE